MSEEAIIGWINQQVGGGRRFTSNREFGIAAGVGENTVTRVARTGRADAPTLAKLADTVGASRVEVFMLAGWLRPQDIHGALNHQVSHLLQLYHALGAGPENARSVWLAEGEAILRLLGLSVPDTEAN